ncbi:trimethylamine methyltransferase family protein [Desulfoluna butyratoxydans]|nr:trimethylamine methyltransferase family protein [Desulfoluna butyratoxydans]
MNQKLQKIHEASMTILRDVGVRLHHQQTLETLKKNGIRVEGDTAFFTEEQIMERVRQAPSSFTLHARNPEHDVTVGAGTTAYIGGYGSPAIIEADGSRRNATFADYLRFIKLVHQTPEFRINGGILAQPSDIAPDQFQLLMTYAAMRFSDKCIMSQPGSAQEVEAVMEMAAILFGGPDALREKPRLIALINTLSPLQMDTHTLETLWAYATHRQPVIIGAGVMCGTTAPVTLAGSLAQGNAETLAGVAIAQIIQPGTPVVMAINTTPVDMRTAGVNIGSPDHALAVTYCAGLSRMYGIPCRCGGTNTDANGPTAQSGAEAMMSMFVSVQEQVSLVIHSAGILDGWAAMSFEKFIADVDIIRRVERFFADTPVDDDALAVDAVRAAGPGGQYLTSPHTMKNCRKASWISDIAVSGPLPEGTTAFEASIGKVHQTMESLVGTYKEPTLAPYTQEALENYLKEKGVDLTVLNHLT